MSLMKKSIRISGLLFLIFINLFLFSCATTVNVNLTRPAQLDLNGARTIAVLPFKPYYYYKEYETSLGTEILINTFYQIFKIKDADEQLIIDSLYSQIEHGLINSPYIKLVSSDSVEKALRKGSLNPADVYLTGEVSYFSVNDRKYDERKLVRAASGDRAAEYQIVHYWKREVDFNFRYQIVDSSNDKVIAVNEYRCSDSSYRYEYKGDLPSAYSIIESYIRNCSKKILKELQPYTVTKSITLLECKTKDKALKDRMKAADELAENAMLAKASDEFQKIYKETGLVEAGYNAAILQEAMGNLSKAEKMMTEVYNANPDSRVGKGLADIQYEINQANRLKKQINETEKTGEDLEGIDDSDDLDLDF
ncbi:hypothetical protein [Treponema bryantii]|uniref:hypothetical protein n=1 Tax=Treponema bryantii TaxID=163 RepID=UPI0003B537C4|nr:hypothetical protein [Treponema bryantii]